MCTCTHNIKCHVVQSGQGRPFPWVKSVFTPAYLSCVVFGWQEQKQVLNDNCQTSLLAVPQMQTSHHHHQLKVKPGISTSALFCSHPNSLNQVQPLGRQNLTLSVSHDNGKSWHAAVTINGGPSAYSALTQIEYKGKRAVACLYERSKDGPPVDFDTVAMAIIDIEGLLL